jgi:putative transposase
MQQAGQFTTVLKYVAGKLGKSVVFLDPKGNSQPGGNCLNKVPKEWSYRWHCCQYGKSMEREKNSAKLIKRLGLNYEKSGGSTSLKKALASREKEAWGLTVLRCSSGLFTGG